MPDFSRELAHGGRVAGVDEVGRGPLAGPVLAAAVLFLRPPPRDLADLLNDSKVLSGAKRDRAFAALCAAPDVLIGIGGASVGDIARLNILHAAMLAMARAVGRLAVAPDLLLVDGNRAPPVACPCTCVVGGDGKSLSIAAASIIAKVVRDRAMWRLDRRYPGYDWGKNAGYPTAAHRAAIVRFGATPHHRMGFGPLKALALGG